MPGIAVSLTLSQLTDTVSKLSWGVMGAYVLFDLLKWRGPASPTALYHKIAAGYAGNTAATLSECFPFWAAVLTGISLAACAVMSLHDAVFSRTRGPRQPPHFGSLATCRLAFQLGLPMLFDQLLAPVSFFAPSRPARKEANLGDVTLFVLLRWFTELVVFYICRITERSNGDEQLERRIVIVVSCVWTFSRLGLCLLAVQAPLFEPMVTLLFLNGIFTWKLGAYPREVKPEVEEEVEKVEEEEEEEEEEDEEEEEEEEDEEEEEEEEEQPATKLGLLYFSLSLFTLVVPFVICCRTPNYFSDSPLGDTQAVRVLVLSAASLTAGCWFNRAAKASPIARPKFGTCLAMVPWVLAACVCVEFHRFQGLPLDVAGMCVVSTMLFCFGVYARNFGPVAFAILEEYCKMVEGGPIVMPEPYY